MYEKIYTADMGREEWLRLRKTGIGGSDAGAVCRLNPFSGPMKVFHDKTCSETEDSDNEAMRQGRDLEDYVAKRFMEATGKKVRRSNYMYRSKEHPFMIADVDRLVVGEEAGLECKTVSAYNADKWKDGSIPLHYVMQCYHYMAVLGIHTWYIAAVVLGRDFICRKLTWDDALVRQMTEVEENFWNWHVVPGIMPEPDGSKICDEVLRRYFRVSERSGPVTLKGFDEKLKRRDELLAEIKALETEQKRIEQEVKLAMGNHECAISGSYRISWSSVSTARIDVKRIKLEQPEIYKDYAKISSSRRFSVKAA